MISASLERSHNTGIYFKNRALRIFPGLWGCLFITVIIFSITGVSFLNLEALKWLPAQMVGIIYTHGFLHTYGFGSYNGALWSITVELQFYVVLPILYLLVPKRSAIYWFSGLIVVFAVGYYLFYTQNYPFKNLLGFTFVPHIYLFLVGVVFQKLQIYKSKFIFNKAHYWIIAYLTIVYLVSPVLVPVSPIAYIFIKHGLLGFTVISMAYTLPGIAKKFLRTNDISYGIYIYHGLIMTVIVQLKLAGAVNLFMILVATYAAATLSWLFIERPFIRRKKNDKGGFIAGYFLMEVISPFRSIYILSITLISSVNTDLRTPCIVSSSHSSALFIFSLIKCPSLYIKILSPSIKRPNALLFTTNQLNPR
ncbi:acyltransferase [Mucilaginibacter sp. S1162]|uniref:Acyltransferase n=1 Tax=Mucilaginibacter humi TaxID=2732510 RepID=A0ABX1VZD3_9SPHI|nr:acyltransferase [Mucilaginibacter humi]NNU33297.1 acyltransferase [Mucilaginibacter humi]